MARAQSNVVGVALLVGVTAVGLGLVAAGAGTVLDAQTDRADATRVAHGLDDAIRPVETTGVRERRLAVHDVTVETAPRTLRVLEDGAVIAERDVGALRFGGGAAGAAFVAGAVLREGEGASDLVRPPRIGVTDGLLAVNAPAIRGSPSLRVPGRETVTVRTAVDHGRTDLGRGTFRVAVETASPGALARHFRDRGRSVERRDVDGDGVPSVVVAFPDADRATLFTHDAEVTVSD